MDHRLWSPQPVFDLWEASYAKKVIIFLRFHIYINIIIIRYIGEVK